MRSLGVCFKPYYNWNTFNTNLQFLYTMLTQKVLNLIITGIPSIHNLGSYCIHYLQF